MTSHSKASHFVGLKYGFRSGLEKRTAAALKAQGIPFKYEELKIEYTKPERTSRYTPDFVIGDLIIELKGRFLTADRQKHILVKAQHPSLDIRFVFSNPQQKISKNSRTTYAMWCEKHGFQYAKETIPTAWLKEAVM